MNSVCIMGLGYIGLPTAIIAAEHKYSVIGFDIDQTRVSRINNHDPVIKEPEIFDRLDTVLQKKMFRATNVIESADYFILAVPTPFKEEKKADLSYVWHAGDILASVLKIGNVIILESTIPVGTTHALAHHLEQKTGLIAGEHFFIAHCPERVLPGNIFYELVHNDRIIGGINTKSTEVATEFYQRFVRGQIHTTTAKVAEMVKLVENSSRDVAIAFANEVSNMAYTAGLNPFEIIELANRHPRVSILQPSCGVGGHCIAVDPWFLIETFPHNTDLIKAARYTNDRKPQSVIATIIKCTQKFKQKNTKNPKVLLLGLTYKQDIDDIRESPALFIAQKISKRTDIELLIAEPHVSINDNSLQKATFVSYKQGFIEADIIVCLVKHTIFRDIPSDVLSEKIILDFCGLFHTMKPTLGTENVQSITGTYYQPSIDLKEHLS